MFYILINVSFFARPECKQPAASHQSIIEGIAVSSTSLYDGLQKTKQKIYKDFIYCKEKIDIIVAVSLYDLIKSLWYSKEFLLSLFFILF